MPVSNRLALVALVAVSAQLAACSEDVTGPPIPADTFRLEVRNWFNTDPIRGVDESLIEFQAVLPNTVTEAELAKIQAMAVRFPALAPKIPIPVDFEPRGDGTVSARATYDRGGGGLTAGEYTLEVEFVTGDTVTAVTSIEYHGINPPEILEVESLEGSAGMRWHAPAAAHEWRVTLQRFDAESETVIADGAFGTSGGGGTFAIAYDFDRDPDAVYGLVLVMTNSECYRRWVVPL
jgi:hypothetical protein